MAELLVKAIDATHPDPVKDARGCYKRGDVVAAVDDGHEWGREECLPLFVVIRLPGVPVEDVKHLLAAHQQFEAAMPEFGQPSRMAVFRRRRQGIDLDQLGETPLRSVNALRRFIIEKV